MPENDLVLTKIRVKLELMIVHQIRFESNA